MKMLSAAFAHMHFRLIFLSMIAITMYPNQAAPKETV